MKARIKICDEIKLIGMRMRMSLADNKIPELWRAFMPLRKSISNATGAEVYSVEIYDSPAFFENFSPANEFEKWAAVPVTDYNSIPDDLKSLIIPSGIYAVFTHKGTAAEAEKTYSNIFRNWLPASGYMLDNRPHFAVMGDKYKNNDPDSEEEIWIPVTKAN